MNKKNLSYAGLMLKRKTGSPKVYLCNDKEAGKSSNIDITL